MHFKNPFQMRSKWLNDYWYGFLLLMTVALVSLWLAREGRLPLYVHPRYIVFTVILCTLAVICAVADMATKKKLPSPLKPVRARHIIGGVLCVAMCGTMLVLRPSGLSSSAATQRGINSAALTMTSRAPLSDLSSAEVHYDQFSVKEWASLLSQTSDVQLFKGKQANITGFVSAARNNPNVFYVSRFVITCCAIDARPIGVPVYLPNWRQTYHEDQWLQVSGVFDQNPEPGLVTIILTPQSVRQVSQPENPYVY